MKYLHSFFVALLATAYFVPISDGISGHLLTSGINAFKTMSSCVEWKASVTAMYSIVLVANVVLPIVWVTKFDVRRVKLGVGHAIGSLALMLYGWSLLIWGIPFGHLDGGAVFMAKVYCNYYFGTFAMLFCIGLATIFFTVYFAVVCKYFYFKTLNRS